MKKLILLSVLSLYLISCSKDNSTYIYQQEEQPSRLESAIFPVITRPAEVVMGNESSVCNPGDNIGLFVSYRVVEDDVQTAVLTITDPLTGAIVREVEMTLSTDESVSNVVVPEEIQGSTFMFANVAVDSDMVGKSWNVSTKIVANKQQSADAVANAFRVE